MPKEKNENRFIEFFRENRKFFLPFKYFVYLVGIVVIILFVLDFGSRAFLEKDFLEEDWEKKRFSRYYYEPYLDFSMSQRDTENPCKDASEDSFLIYTFGGSTMWGVFAKEGEDIASNISKLLCEKGIPVEVKNFGTLGYVNTQEVIKLFLELGDGRNPDIVIFYDGANDIGAAGYRYVTPKAFEYFLQRAGYRAGSFPNLKEYLARYFGKDDLSLVPEDEALDRYFSSFQLRTDNLYGEELYEKVMEIYLNNVKMVKTMEEDFGFKSFFYWQPTLYDKIGSFSEEEEIIFSGESSMFKRFRTAEPVVNESLGRTKNVRDLRNIFSGRPDTVFTDWIHITGENNKIIAEKMTEDIIKYLEEKSYYEKK